MRWTEFDSPIGVLAVGIDDVGVCGVHFGPVEGALPAAALPWATAPATTAPATTAPAAAGLRAAVGQFRAYFAGELTEFALPLSVRRGSEFERAVWTEMSKIPYGETRTYGQLAAAVGDPGAARAVGVACNRNPIPVIVPCHRIVGAGGKLVGFGGGLPRKRQLLELEARIAFERAWA
ncbi:methylated-DNA--[protein]-cysteine S-methyltransferase [Micromonospora sp. WMMD1102]|uniref:methylated-DNA--[protein]-cysteine S-methyltransferase n=1 Tax=Micromonospora sp. WMMD1102 TaxID=3016105 RepID=UPI002414FE91|nr:methylated-DNA--[protein]-cysteine S-methyltransferase [Micromonospora sp. WMMD1102]MDG4790907.1 methylated-DNA--[protein]-cysteine S-methyltransferase [Micromonospora sp. WMMD1102]